MSAKRCEQSIDEQPLPAGLDARAAAIVMRSVRAAVDTGRTVVATIHQPSIDIFESFDDLLLMKARAHACHQPKEAQSFPKCQVIGMAVLWSTAST